MSNADDVFNRIIDAAKKYRPEYEGHDPPLVDVLVDLDGHLPDGFFTSLGHNSSPFQPSEIRKERREWKERQEEARREHRQNPIRYYCDQIRGIIPDYEMSFEEDYKASLEHLKMRHEKTENLLESLGHNHLPDEMTELEKRVYDIEVWSHGKRERKIERLTTPPEGMTKKQWKKEKTKKRKLEREEKKREKLDRDYEYYNSPKKRLSDMIYDVGCECEAEKMRAGKFCDTCVLLSRVAQYTIDIFKAAADGRSNYV